MAKLTIAQLNDLVKDLTAAQLQAGEWTASFDNFAGLVDKVSKTIMIDGDWNIDKLTKIDGENLEYANSIEEYFINLILPTLYTTPTEEGAKDLTPALPSVEEVSYSYPLDRIKLKTTVPFYDIEKGLRDAQSVANITTTVLGRLAKSYDTYRYATKKQLLGNVITKALDKGLSMQVTVPVDTETSDAFIKQIKTDVEAAGFINENSLSGALIGAIPKGRAILYVKKGTVPALQVHALASAFNPEQLGLGCEVVVVEDFGDADENVFALLMDDRGVKLHNKYKAIRQAPNADGDFVNYVLHANEIGFISTHTYVKAYSINLSE